MMNAEKAHGQQTFSHRLLPILFIRYNNEYASTHKQCPQQSDTLQRLAQTLHDTHQITTGFCHSLQRYRINIISIIMSDCALAELNFFLLFL